MGKTVIFDMDGVLIDSEPFYFKRRMDFFKFKGIQPGSDKFEDHVGDSEKQTWEMLIPEDEITHDRLHREYLHYKQRHGIDLSKTIRESVSSALEQLRVENIVIELASSSPRKEIDQMLSDCKLERYFSHTISGEELKESKPNPEIYSTSRDALACDDCLAVEDSTLGTASAKAASIYTVALKQGFFMDQSKADIIINELTELVILP